MSINNSKNALVTGGARRLGREIAIDLARNGWNVAVHHNTTSADEVVAEIKKLGRKAVAIKADLVNFSETKNIITQANKQLGEISLLVNSASLFEHIKFMETDENTFDSHMDVHVKAPFFLAQDFACQCKHGGQIINIIDSAVNRKDGQHFTYFLAKKSLRNLSQMLADQLAPKILVNAVFPGIIKEFSNNVDPQFLQKQQLVSAKQVTDAIISLTKSETNGQEIFIDDGGQSS